MKPPSSIFGMKPVPTLAKLSTPTAARAATPTTARIGRPTVRSRERREKLMIRPLGSTSATLLRDLISCSTITGTSHQATRNDTVSDTAMVIDSALKKAPVTPVRKASGRQDARVRDG